jgi:hypothetical protein
MEEVRLEAPEKVGCESCILLKFGRQSICFYEPLTTPL